MSEKSAENPKELSPEEIDKRRAAITNFYKGQIKYLKVQLEYESLMTEIEENRAKRLQAQMFLAQAAHAENEEEMGTEEVEAAKREFEEAMAQRPERKLKKEV
jgi:hypothetical protein